MCPPETRIGIFLICQHSICYTGGHEFVAQGCVDGVTLVFWLLCLPWEEVPSAVTVTKTSAQGLLFTDGYTLSIMNIICGIGSAFSKPSLFHVISEASR